jgi:hypothetical protein
MKIVKFVCAAAFFAMAQAQAALISVEFDKTQYQVGETIVSQLFVSDFSGPLTGATLSLGIGSAFSLDGVQISDAFDDGLGDYRFADFVAGQLFVEAYADWAAAQNVLANKQQSRFLLATISFKALTAGLYQFSFDEDYSGVIAASSDFVSSRLSAPALTIAATSSVNAPATVFLLAGSCWLLAGLRRKRATQGLAGKTTV